MTDILILEDNNDLCTLYARTFTEEGYQSRFAPTLMDARRLLQDHTYDVFLCDMQLGNEHGLTLLKEQRAVLITGSTTTIVVSAQEKYRRACEDLGVEFFISKPIDMQALTHLIKRLVSPHKEA